MQKSEQINELAGALAKARASFKAVKKDAENPYFKSKYADLNSIIDATFKALSENGLSIVQLPSEFNAELGLITVETWLLHSSGQFLSGSIQMPTTKSDPQGIGSALTYARRYAYGAILSVAAEEDDDGNAASGKSQGDRFSKGSTEKGPGTINLTQQRAFWAAVTKSGKTKAQVREWLQTALSIEHTIEIPKSDFDMAMKFAVSAPAVPAVPQGSDEMQDALSRSLEALGEHVPTLEEELAQAPPTKPLASPKLEFGNKR